MAAKAAKAKQVAPKATAKKAAPAPKRKTAPELVEVRNVNHPGATQMRDRVKYEAAWAALKKALPTKGPGLTQREMLDAMLAHLPEDLFPGGARGGWWMKTVQLDQEARGTIARDGGKPLRWRRVK